jgi:NADPH-dependent 2,4-dienoyl-CoA reductase/sulfur reductase-like enzyme/nitrite reductase/ring-hydroxylating ferredoxin subunit
MEYDGGAAVDLAEGAMRRVEIRGRPILLARVAGVCHAVGAVCPHAGGPLEQGVLRGDIVTCPWHKARFRVSGGELVDPPAVDALPRHPVRERGGRLLVLESEPPRPAVPGGEAVADRRCVVIAGGGAAGAMAAQTLRDEGFTGRVVMIDREDRLPYDRTVLSKYALAGKRAGEKSPLQDSAFYAAHNIERVAATISRIDHAAHRIELGGGGSLAYDFALVAAGGTPRALDVPGSALPRVFLLRSAADAQAIADAAGHAHNVVIAGAGFIGMEAAACLRQMGLAVTVVAPEQVPFERQLGGRIGAMFRLVHERNGVAFRLGDAIAAVEGTDQAQWVRLRSGARLPADLVLAGLGVRPNTAMLTDLPLREDGGVAVDAQLRAADGLYMAGDIAAFPVRGDRIRVEHWRVAQQHGRLAARNMLGAALAYDAVPYFWTTHFDQRLDYVGHAEEWDDLVVDGTLDTPDFIAWYVRAGLVRAVAGWGRDRRMAGVLNALQDQPDWTLADLRQATEHLDA